VRGFRPSYYLFAVGAICGYGFYKVGKGIREQQYVRPNLSLHRSLSPHTFDARCSVQRRRALLAFYSQDVRHAPTVPRCPFSRHGRCVHTGLLYADSVHDFALGGNRMLTVAAVFF
jgi:hypothetical protein